MDEKKEIEHALLLEDFAFISALIMQKNFINSKNIEGNSTVPPVEPPTEEPS